MKQAILPASIAALLCAAAQTQAGGLWLNEYGDFSGGRSSAGASAGLDEAATIIHNPASGKLIEGKQLFASAGMLLPETKFDIDYTNPISGNDNGGSAGENAPAASFAYVHDTGSEDWNWGFYTAGLAGAGLDYNDDWVGRFQTTKVEIMVLALAGTLSYQITDDFAIGAAVQYYYGSLDMDLQLPSLLPGREEGNANLEGSDDGFAFALGALWELSDRTRLGINYQSELELDFDGKLKADTANIDGRVDSNTELPLAQMVRLSLRHDLDDQIGFSFTVGWDDWSALDEVFVALPERGASLEKNWDDTYHYAAGFHYKVSPDWEITSGIAYDTNPVDATDRTADLPVDRQVRYSAGARYQFRDNLTLGGYINYIDLGSAKIRGQFWGGEYQDNSVIGIAFNLNWVL